MTPSAPAGRALAWIFALGLFAFLILTLRFSPNWIAFGESVREMAAETTNADQRDALEPAILSGFSERGLHVIRQSRDLGTEIKDSNHKIVRWRLLMPAIGHVFHLPGWLTLGLSHLGCLTWLVALVAVGHSSAGPSGSRWRDAACLALVAGASAPLFTSMGLLGYYDAWLVVALLAVGFGPARWIVALACLLGPWIDERFVIGLPLALMVRWTRTTEPACHPWAWLRREAALPLLLAGGYSLVRLQLGGSGSSQTVGEYFRQFVLTPTISTGDRLLGAWAGLRSGWVLVVAAVALVGLAARPLARLQMAMLAAGIVLTGLVGLYTALDLSRSMALLTPVIPLGWLLLSRTEAWNRYHLPPILAATALLLPAHHVMGPVSLPVDNFLSPSLPLRTAQNNVGIMYDNGTEVPRDLAKALYWYRRSAEAGHAEAQNNVGAKYTLGEGVPQDHAMALSWYLKAATQGDRTAEYNLGVMYTEGTGVAKDPVEAVKWYRRAADKGLANAQNNLGAMYLDGRGVPQNSVEAVKWYARAAVQGMGSAATNLGVVYLEGKGLPSDVVQAYRWLLIAASMGDGRARDALPAVERMMRPDQVAEGRRIAQATLDRLKKK